MGSTNVDDIPRRVEGAVYTAVGLGILGFQSLQVQRRQVERSLFDAFGEMCGAFTRVASGSRG